MNMIWNHDTLWFLTHLLHKGYNYLFRTNSIFFPPSVLGPILWYTCKWDKSYIIHNLSLTNVWINYTIISNEIHIDSMVKNTFCIHKIVSKDVVLWLLVFNFSNIELNELNCLTKFKSDIHPTPQLEQF
jgi:hypothetical protein